MSASPGAVAPPEVPREESPPAPQEGFSDPGTADDAQEVSEQISRLGTRTTRVEAPRNGSPPPPAGPPSLEPPATQIPPPAPTVEPSWAERRHAAELDVHAAAGPNERQQFKVAQEQSNAQIRSEDLTQTLAHQAEQRSLKSDRRQLIVETYPESIQDTVSGFNSLLPEGYELGGWVGDQPGGDPRIPFYKLADGQRTRATADEVILAAADSLSVEDMHTFLDAFVDYHKRLRTTLGAPLESRPAVPPPLPLPTPDRPKASAPPKPEILTPVPARSETPAPPPEPPAPPPAEIPQEPAVASSAAAPSPAPEIKAEENKPPAEPAAAPAVAAEVAPLTVEQVQQQIAQISQSINALSSELQIGTLQLTKTGFELPVSWKGQKVERLAGTQADTTAYVRDTLLPQSQNEVVKQNPTQVMQQYEQLVQLMTGHAQELVDRLNQQKPKGLFGKIASTLGGFFRRK